MTCCPASSVIIVEPGEPLGATGTTEARVSLVWTGIIASFPEMQCSPHNQHNEVGSFLAGTPQSTAHFLCRRTKLPPAIDLGLHRKWYSMTKMTFLDAHHI